MKENLSMGCDVSECSCGIPGCSVAKDVDAQHRTINAWADTIEIPPGVPGTKIREVPSNVQFISASLVPAPKCSKCLEPMVAATSLEWACSNEKCSEEGTLVNTGVYPFWKIS
jgi:hypothetical protein